MAEKPKKIHLAQEIAGLLDTVNNTSLKKHRNSDNQGIFIANILEAMTQECGDAQRTLPPVGLQDVDSSRGLSPVCASMDTVVKIGQPILQVLLVLPPCHPVHSRRCLPLKGTEALSKKRYRHMMKQGREANLLIPSRGFAYSAQSLGHAFPALSQGHVGERGVLLGLRPSLPNLCCG